MLPVFVDVENPRCLSYIRTGSNAYILSGELATLLSGRYVEISMLPLSFKEYLQAVSSDGNPERSFREYQLNSSFPGHWN